MKLATSAEVLSRMNLTGTSSANTYNSIESSLEAATTVIESILRTSLADNTVTDYYSYTVGRFDSFTPFDVYLSQQFVNKIVGVYYAEDGLHIQDLTAATLLDATDYIVDQTKGKITILKSIPVGYKVLAVKYAAGYREGSRDIPEVIKQAAISATIAVTHTFAVSHGKKDTKSMSAVMYKMCYTQLQQHIFTPYTGLMPIHSAIA